MLKLGKPGYSKQQEMFTLKQTINRLKGFRMKKKCSLCNNPLGMFENYGTYTSPLCYECVNKMECSQCKMKLSIDNIKNYFDQIVWLLLRY